MEPDCSGLGYLAYPVVEVSRLDHLAMSWGQGLLPALDSVPTMGAVLRQVLRKWKLDRGYAGAVGFLEVLRPVWNPQSQGLV